jgi:DNA-binding winged helix-turn-helix (wHTH) protein
LDIAWDRDDSKRVSAIVLDIGTRLVRRDGIDIQLTPKAFDLLLMLVRQQPDVVPHEQIRAALWPGVHVSETSLAALVAQLRKALGDSAGVGRVIRTRHRVGYAFVGEASIARQGPQTVASICRLIWHGQTFELPLGQLVIGRDRGCDVRIDADSVSRRHARVIVTAADATIEDMGSKNGTWVAGQRMTGPMTLADGITIRLGSETVRFEATSDPSTRTAVVH